LRKGISIEMRIGTAVLWVVTPPRRVMDVSELISEVKLLDGKAEQAVGAAGA
jgi:hypothetical protein